MKTAVYIEDGVIQLVLTPENKFEKDTLSAFAERAPKLEVQVFEGQFYDCRGGWTRQKDFHPIAHMAAAPGDCSLIIRHAKPTVIDP